VSVGASTFAALICRLVTLSFSEGKFAEHYTHALVTPLLKKKQGLDSKELGNYRPITNLHTTSKLVEHIVMTPLVKHVNLSPNFNEFQSAYRPGCSTETALVKMLSNMYCADDNGRRSILLQLDLSSAFDTLDKCTLLGHLRYTFGISGPAFNWISSYLVCRTQSVCVGEKQSASTECEYGVPQGSVLGPLLLSLYMSPVAHVIGSFAVNRTQYADDTQLYVALSEEKSIPTLTDCFHAVHHWLDRNGLSLASSVG
jgi:Reverse transcriptase (RNA-dependent DNA polymerase)